MTRNETVTVAEASIHADIGGHARRAPAVTHPDATNRESAPSRRPPVVADPRRSTRPASGCATAFSELAWTTESSISEGDLVVTYGTMSGRHTGNFVVWTEDAQVERVFVPTGKAFSVRQAHFQRIRDGLVVEHWAVRDDQGMARPGRLDPADARLPDPVRARHEEGPSDGTIASGP